MTSTELVTQLKKLRLSGVLQTLDLRVRQAVEDNLDHTEFLYRLLTDEVDRRDGKQLHLRLARACFENERTLEGFDFTFNPEIPKSRILDLATCNFVGLNEVVILVGRAGTGKSHIAQAIGHRAVRRGMTVLYTGASQMFSVLRASRGDGSYDRKLLRYTTPELLIVDDLGLRPFRGDEPEDLYEVIRQRYERGAMILTTNRDIPELAPLFGDALLASAAMDRLLHHAHVVVLDGESYRNPARGRGTRQKPSSDA
jgi:DNA replication protein DnaC